MRISLLPSRMRARVAFWALSGVLLLVSHDAVFLAQLGPGEVLSRTLRQAAHDYWGTASLAVAVVGAAAALAIALRIVRLRQRAAALGVRPLTAGRRGYLRRVASVWLALFAVVVIGFLIQENLEHAGAHGHLIGIGALIGPEYPLAIPVIGLISLGAAFVGAAIGGAERALVAAIAQILRHVLRPPRRLARAPLRLGSPRRSPLAGTPAGRAPPRRLVPIT